MISSCVFTSEPWWRLAGLWNHLLRNMIITISFRTFESLHLKLRWCCMFLTKMTSVTLDTHLRYPGCRARRAGVRLGIQCRWRFPGSRRSSDWPGTHGASGRAVGTSSSPSTNRCECRWRLTARGLAEGGQGWGLVHKSGRQWWCTRSLMYTHKHHSSYKNHDYHNSHNDH